jgi:hypothetical protein
VPEAGARDKSATPLTSLSPDDRCILEREITGGHPAGPVNGDADLVRLVDLFG